MMEKSIASKMNIFNFLDVFAGYCIIVTWVNAESLVPNTSFSSFDQLHKNTSFQGGPIPLPFGFPSLINTISPLTTTSSNPIIPTLNSGEVNRISNLTVSPTRPKPGSSVVITGLVEITSQSPVVKFPILWKIGQVPAAYVIHGGLSFPSLSHKLSAITSDSIYKNRTSVDLTPSQYVAPATISMSLTITNLTMMDNGLSISLSDIVQYNSIFTLEIYQECDRVLPHQVSVINDSLKNQSKGTFTCLNGGELVYSNGTAPTTNETVCNSQFKWNDQTGLQCWTAPNVSITTVFFDRAGNLGVLCIYDPVTPVGHYSLFFVGDKFYNRTKSFPLLLSNISKSERGKSIYCQADTPFTRKHNSTGRSRSIRMSFFPPDQNKTTNCYWYLNSSGICHITFYSNPLSVFRNLTKHGGLVMNEVNNSVIVNAEKHEFYFVRNKVTEADAGSYRLVVSFARYPALLFGLTYQVSVFPLTSKPAVTCSWFVGRSGSCVVPLANDSTAYSLTKDGKLIKNSSVLSLFTDSKSFRFEVNKATKADQGTYALSVMTPSLPSSPVVVFDVFTLDYPFDSALIIGLTVLVLVLILVLIVGVVHHAKARKALKKEAATTIELKSQPYGKKASIPTATGQA